MEAGTTLRTTSARAWLRNEADLVPDTRASSPTALAEWVEATVREQTTHGPNPVYMRKAPIWREQRDRSFTPHPPDLKSEPTDCGVFGARLRRGELQHHTPGHLAKYDQC